MKGNRYVIVEKECRGTCVHYRQHFISEKGRFWPIWYGHCGTPRMKQRQPDEGCPHWAPGIPPDDVESLPVE